MVPTGPPTVDSLLKLQPPVLEELFWKSDVHRRSCRTLDLLSCALCIAFHALVLKKFRDDHPQLMDALKHVTLVHTTYITVALVQLGLLMSAEHEYYQWRNCLLYSNRLLRLLHLTTSTTDWARGLDAITHPPASYLCGHSKKATIRAVLRWSSSGIVLIQSCSSPLPFRHQLLAHLATLAALLPRLRPGVALVLRTDCHNPIRVLCYILHLTGHTTQAAFISAFSNSPPDTCLSDDAIAMVMLFAQILTGFLLPVFMAYRMEQQMKTSYANLVRSGALVVPSLSPPLHPLPPLPSCSFPRAADGAVLFWLVLLTWTAVSALQLQQHLC